MKRDCLGSPTASIYWLGFDTALRQVESGRLGVSGRGSPSDTANISWEQITKQFGSLQRDAESNMVSFSYISHSGRQISTL